MPGRELVTNFKITNEGKEAVRIGEFATAGLRFLNPDVFTTKVDYPDYLLAERGLSLSDNSPIGRAKPTTSASPFRTRGGISSSNSRTLPRRIHARRNLRLTRVA